MSAEYIQIYRNINKDITIGNWTVRDLFLPLGAYIISKFFMLGIFETIIIIGLSFYGMVLLKELNETKLKGYYKSMIWWYGLIRGEYKSLPKSYMREFVK